MGSIGYQIDDDRKSEPEICKREPGKDEGETVSRALMLLTSCRWLGYGRRTFGEGYDRYGIAGRSGSRRTN